MGHHHAAFYDIGSHICAWRQDQLELLCGDKVDACLQQKRMQTCRGAYSSGPPWFLHKDDAEAMFGVWSDSAILVHEIWDNVFAEQAAYSVSQMQSGITSSTNKFWFVSAPQCPHQRQTVWPQIARSSYDPCRERGLPAAEEELPPFFHYCLGYEIPHLKDQSYKISKYKLPKDLLDCESALIRYNP